MNLPKQHVGFSQKLLVVALLAAIGPAHAADDEVAQLIKPDSAAIGVGLGYASGDEKDRTLFGQYNGLRDHDANLLLDFDYINRDDASGLWTNAEGRNLGLDNREIRFSQQKQGDWKYSAEYSELVRHDPRTINTGLQGAGSTNPVVMSLAVPGTGSDLNLELKRKGFTLAGEKWFAPNLSFEASFKTEDKDGSRLFGVGNYCSNAVAGPTWCSATVGALLLLPEPINSTTRQFEAKLNYIGDNYSVNVGYYGSFYNNSNGALNPRIGSNLVNPDGTVLNVAAGPGATLAGLLQQPVALPPDNQAHQFNLAGTYRFTPTTRANFNLTYTHATQDQDFGSAGTSAAAGLPGNAGGVMDRTFVQAAVTTQPMAGLVLLADGRYEDLNDKTTIANYNGAFTNTPNGSKKGNAKVEASYQFPDNFRGILGVDYAHVERDHPVGTTSIPATSLTALRDTTNEVTYRGEVRRSMSETLNASLSAMHSYRQGYNWTDLAPGYPYIGEGNVYSATGAFPFTMMDRTRDKFKVLVDWMPMSNLSLQLTVENGKDRYAAPTNAGMHNNGMNAYGIDAAYTISDKWKLTAYANQGQQTLRVDHNIGYQADLKNISTAAGIGVVGKIDSRLEVGGDLTYLDDSNRYQQSMGNGAAIVDPLPDVTYRLLALKLYGKYALDKNADIRLDLVYQQNKLNEWTWGANGVPFLYADNTTVSMQQNQNVTFLGARYIYKFK